MPPPRNLVTEPVLQEPLKPSPDVHRATPSITLRLPPVNSQPATPPLPHDRRQRLPQSPPPSPRPRSPPPGPVPPEQNPLPALPSASRTPHAAPSPPGQAPASRLQPQYDVRRVLPSMHQPLRST